MSDPTPPGTPAPQQDFGAESEHLDRKLDDALAKLRASLAYGRITAREAADLRIGLLTEHLSALRALRIEHFGEGDPATGWISGDGGDVMIRVRALLLPAAVAAAAAIAVLAPASAQTRPAAVPRGHQQVVADVSTYRPTLRSVPRKPPLTTLIQYDETAYVAYYPQQFHINVTLKWWRSARALHRLRGRWVVIHPSLGWGIADLPQAGGPPAVLSPSLDWECEPGAYYARVHTWGIDHRGRPQSDVEFFPWKGFVKGHPLKGNVNKPPSLRKAWHTRCQGSDGLRG